MSNSLTDLNGYLFDALNAVSNTDKKGEELQEEVTRGKAVANIAKVIISNSQLALNATKFLADNGYTITQKNNAALQLLGNAQGNTNDKN